MFRFIVVVISVIIINGCSQLPPTQVGSTIPDAVKPNTKEEAWQKRQDYLKGKQAWNLNSKVALRFGEENVSFRLNWLQQPAMQYVMQIINPLTGALVARLSRNSGGVSLLADNGKLYQDSDEERLLQNQSGLKLPVKGMQYWVRGITSPNHKVDALQLDAMGRPQVLQQAGWKITYSRYANNNYNAMPNRVVLVRSKDDVYVKMIAKQWQGI